MDDSQLVAVVESVEEGCNDVAGLRLGEPLALQDLIEELYTEMNCQIIVMK